MKEQQIEIKVNDETLKGQYANAMQISHSENEFFLDFLLIHPPAGQLVDRIIVSPGHLKRVKEAIDDNLKRYEATFGKIEVTQEPKGIGFHAQ